MSQFAIPVTRILIFEASNSVAEALKSILCDNCNFKPEQIVIANSIKEVIAAAHQTTPFTLALLDDNASVEIGTEFLTKISHDLASLKKPYSPDDIQQVIAQYWGQFGIKWIVVPVDAESTEGSFLSKDIFYIKVEAKTKKTQVCFVDTNEALTKKPFDVALSSIPIGNIPYLQQVNKTTIVNFNYLTNASYSQDKAAQCFLELKDKQGKIEKILFGNNTESTYKNVYQGLNFYNNQHTEKIDISKYPAPKN